MKTLTQIDIPPTNVKDIGCGFEDDYIRELGDRIASLTLAKARELNEYLRSCCRTKDKFGKNFLNNPP